MYSLSIHDATTNTFLSDLIETGVMWIGAIKSGYGWAWVDLSSWNYEKWRQRSIGPEHPCGMFTQSGWMGRRNSYGAKYVCMKRLLAKKHN